MRSLPIWAPTVEPIAPPFPADKLWQAWTTLRAMLNAGGFKAIYDDPEKRAKLKPETIWEIEQGRSLTAQAVYEASVIRSRYYAHMARLFQTYDAVVLPTAQVWPFPAEWRSPQAINGVAMDTYHRWMEVVIPISLIGLPAISLPLGFGAKGLPMGMTDCGACRGRCRGPGDGASLSPSHRLAEPRAQTIASRPNRWQSGHRWAKTARR